MFYILLFVYILIYAFRRICILLSMHHAFKVCTLSVGNQTHDLVVAIYIGQENFESKFSRCVLFECITVDMT